MPTNEAAATRTYDIPDENLTRFIEKMIALGKRALKLGFEPPTYAIGESIEREVTRREEANDFRFDGEEGLDFGTVQEFVTYHRVTVSGQSPKIDGWRFAATADYAELPVIIRALVTDVAIPERFRTLGPACEHCNLDRARKDCCILVRDSGEWIQVGKSCLKDFLGHKSPERLAEMAELLAEMADACGGFCKGEGKADPALVHVLMWASSVVSRLGWTPKSKADFDALYNPNGREATATIVSDYMGLYDECAKKGQKFPYPLPTKSDFERAKAAVEWAKALSGSSDYELNVKAIAARSGVSLRNWGIAVSLIGSYNREMAKYSERVASEFVGTVGRKIGCTCTKKACKCAPIKILVTKVIPLPDYGYGASYVNIMRDAQGNALTWKTGTCLSTGSEYTLTGTVKAHDDSKYGKQTVLTRCKAEIVKHDVEGNEAA